MKRITKENDNLRRELSRIGGLCRFTTNDQNVEGITNSQKCTSDDLQTVNAKLESLRVHVADVANTLMSLAGEECAVMSVGTRPSTTPNQQSTNHPPVAQPPESYPIPAVPIGLARREAETTNHSSTSTMVAANNRGTYAHATAHQPRQQHSRQPTNDKVCVIGTSLTRGLGQRLSSRGISATTYSYPGAQIPLIRNRVPHILPKSNDTTAVLLQCGGNDTDSNNPDPVIDQLEGLIRDIRQQRPNSDILFSSIPPWPRNRKALRNINYINDYFRDRGARNDRVKIIYVVPKMPEHFAKDKIHFSENGKKLYACN